MPRIHPTAYVDDSAQAIGDHVTIGHAAVIHGCVIDDACLIGMGAILLNGARIGEGSLVAAGTLIAEGMNIPPRSLVMGSPGVEYRLDYMPPQGSSR
jgi:carbonic anhydrase/acetyltransferase-like protein (isoleucine patch superfamily)